MSDGKRKRRREGKNLPKSLMTSSSRIGHQITIQNLPTNRKDISNLFLSQIPFNRPNIHPILRRRSHRSRSSRLNRRPWRRQKRNRSPRKRHRRRQDSRSPRRHITSKKRGGKVEEARNHSWSGGDAGGEGDGRGDEGST